MARILLIDEIGDAARALKLSGTTIAVAESCTGGLISHKLTNINGSSDFFLLGLVAYTNQAKRNMLQVKAGTLKKHGAVSPEVAREMAEGISRLADSDIGISITGFADGERAGEVYLGIHDRKSDATEIKNFRLVGGRENIKEQAAMIAIEEISRISGVSEQTQKD
ncbi:MAG: CinA family protein [Thermoplasmata archaeon]|nr:CinA family protein [Thermoplasmata archaeon]